MHHPTDRIAHTTALVTPVVEHWLEQEIAQWVHPMKVASKPNDGIHLTIHITNERHMTEKFPSPLMMFVCFCGFKKNIFIYLF